MKNSVYVSLITDITLTSSSDNTVFSVSTLAILSDSSLSQSVPTHSSVVSVPSDTSVISSLLSASASALIDEFTASVSRTSSEFQITPSTTFSTIAQSDATHFSTISSEIESLS